MKRLNEFKNFIFDLDGTLIDSSEDILTSLKQAYNQANIEYDDNSFDKRIIGPPMKEIVHRISPSLSDELVSVITKNYRQIYDNGNFEKTKMYEGIYDALIQLKNEGKNIFIATNKPYIPTMRLLQAFQIDFFKKVMTVDYIKGERTPKDKMIEIIIDEFKLNPKESVMIGDSLSDIKAGKKNNLYTIGALYGYETKDVEEESDLAVKSGLELYTLFESPL